MKDIRRATRKLHSSEEKIRIVLSGLRGEDSIAEVAATQSARSGLPVKLAGVPGGLRAAWSA